jgi:hypothetical protein
MARSVWRGGEPREEGFEEEEGVVEFGAMAEGVADVAVLAGHERERGGAANGGIGCVGQPVEGVDESAHEGCVDVP